jgi:hypothetical protein
LPNQFDDCLFALPAREPTIVTPATNRQRQRMGATSSGQLSRTTSSNAAQLISDIAAELRAPLSAVKVSVESMQAGEVGTITGRQRAMLATVIEQCDDLDRMVGKLAQVDQQRLAVPRVTRRGVVVSEIRDAVDQVLVNDGIPHSIDVLWDGADDPNLMVFVDPTLIRKMIVHMVTESVQVTPHGGCVLIRLQSQPSGDVVRWSVIDQGPGIREHEVESMLTRGHDPSSPFGLTACQQIAALHFSPLDLYSRIGSGTEISFNTPKFLPRSVVAVWSQWRSSIEGGAQPTSIDLRPSGGAKQQLRIDSATARMSLSHPSTTPTCGDQLTAGTVSLGAAVSKSSANAFDRFLQRQLQMYDLVYRVGVRRWVWAFDTRPSDVGQRIESLMSRSASVISGLRMNWSDPMMIPVDGRQTNLRLCELLVRESLSESTAMGIVDKDTVRMGTAPLERSQLTTDRMNEELRRLSGQLRMQTQRLQRQAKQLRPRA